MANTDQALQIINKIASVERSKHISDAQKAILITSLKNQLDAAVGQAQIQGLEGGSTPPAPAPKAAK